MESRKEDQDDVHKEVLQLARNILSASEHMRTTDDASKKLSSLEDNYRKQLWMDYFGGLSDLTRRQIEAFSLVYEASRREGATNASGHAHGNTFSYSRDRNGSRLKLSYNWLNDLVPFSNARSAGLRELRSLDVVVEKSSGVVDVGVSVFAEHTETHVQGWVHKGPIYRFFEGLQGSPSLRERLQYRWKKATSDDGFLSESVNWWYDAAMFALADTHAQRRTDGSERQRLETTLGYIADPIAFVVEGLANESESMRVQEKVARRKLNQVRPFKP